MRLCILLLSYIFLITFLQTLIRLDSSKLVSNMFKSSLLSKGASLFISTRQDPASLNIFKHLCQLDSFIPINSPHLIEYNSLNSMIDSDEDIVMKTYNLKGRTFYLWLQNSPLLKLDFADELFVSKFNELNSIPSEDKEELKISDILFLSKHSAASGTRSLTIHPIGIPWLADSKDTGGKPGKCVPPHLDIAGLFRKISNEIKVVNLNDKYQVTLEATHHGPYAQVPSCFIEIGSSENEWSEEEAGKIWANCIKDYYQFVNIQNKIEPADLVTENLITNPETRPSYMVLCIGGGHYVPKLNDIAKLSERIFIGHGLASYTLANYFTSPVDSCLFPSGWEHVITEAIESCKYAMPPNCELICLVDKKAFTSKPKNDILSLLASLNVKWILGVSDMKKLSNQIDI